MRVMHVNKFLYRRGGAEAYMEDVASRQQARGDEVAFFGMDHPENTHVGLAKYFPSNVEMEPAPPGAAGKLKVAARTIWSRSAGTGLAGAMADFRPDVIHFHNVYHQLSPSVVVAAKKAGVPAVMTVHDYKLVCPSYLFLDQDGPCEACLGGDFTQPVRRRCKGGSISASALLAVETALHRKLGSYGGIDAFLCPSQFLRDKLSEGGVYPERLRVLHNFVDVSPGRQWKGPGGPLLFVGRLEHYKGIDLLVRAVGQLPEGVTLDIAGEGPERADLEALAAEVAPGRVRFHGRLPKHAVEDLVEACSALVLASRCYENQPLVVLEAMAVGVPAVGTALGGITELLGPTGAGVLAPPEDVDGLTAALRRLLDDPAAARAAGARGRETFDQHYSAEVHMRQLDEVYAEVTRTVRAGEPLR